MPTRTENYAVSVTNRVQLLRVGAEEADQLGIDDVRHLLVGVVADVRNQEDLSVGENLGGPPRVAGELRPVDLSAEDQRLRP